MMVVVGKVISSLAAVAIMFNGAAVIGHVVAVVIGNVLAVVISFVVVVVSGYVNCCYR